MAHYFSRYTSESPILVGPAGDDFRPFAADFKLLPEPSRPHTLVYKNITHLGERTQHCQFAEYAEPVELTRQLQEVIASADIICLAPLLPNYPASYVRTLLADRKPTSLTVLLPQGYLREVTKCGAIRQRSFAEAKVLVPLFNLVILSEADHTNVRTFIKRYQGRALYKRSMTYLSQMATEGYGLLVMPRKSQQNSTRQMLIGTYL